MVPRQKKIQARTVSVSESVFFSVSSRFTVCTVSRAALKEASASAEKLKAAEQARLLSEKEAARKAELADESR